MIVYGIKNCNTVKKALDWLNEQKIEYVLHDFKKLGISQAKLEEWTAQVGWEPLVNKRGTTWRQLEPERQKAVVSLNEALNLMQEKTSVIKRPVIETEKGILLGFEEAEYKNSLLK
jgi:arsenate reductase